MVRNAKIFRAIFLTAIFAIPFYLLQARQLQAQRGIASLDKEKERAFVESNIRFATTQTKEMIRAVDSNLVKKSYPRTTFKNGSLASTNMYDWTSGFFPGTLWYLYELSHDDFFKAKAKAWTISLEPLKAYTKTHDLGFMMYCSFGNGYRLAPDETAAYKDIIIQGAGSLCTRYSDTTRCIKSWETSKSWNGVVRKFPVIIDNMMNLEMLMWAAKATSDPAEAAKLRRIAVTHANTTLKNHLRPDYSAYHVISYDPQTGEVESKTTAQGWSDSSTWSRGQAWGLYGFTVMYRETGDKNYLEAAKKMTDFFLNHPNLPADKIPYWDFNAQQDGYVPTWPDRTSAFPVSPDKFPIAHYRDASAGAIVASALFELYGYTKNEAYLASAVTMLHSLASDAYKTKLGENANFLLKHCVGSIPHGSEIDVPLVYADYYFLEALLRYYRLLNS
ncbi:MAG: glycoside hydrolase family 88 protein [Prevotellaceae bacterium]|jgi:chondroitin AC lyase|nr:glycoside hydrolase family 88 protein [Prevotellaceae bacterium]